MKQHLVDRLIANTKRPEFADFCGHDERRITQSRLLTRFVAERIKVGHEDLVVSVIMPEHLSANTCLLSNRSIPGKTWRLSDQVIRRPDDHPGRHADDVEALGDAMVQGIQHRINESLAKLRVGEFIVWAPLWLVAHKYDEDGGYWCTRGYRVKRRAW